MRSLKRLLLLMSIAITLFTMMLLNPLDSYQPPSRTGLLHRVARRFYSSVLNMSDCDILLSTISEVEDPNYKIQVVAAAPGSGSALTYDAVPLLTGLLAEATYNFEKSELEDLPKALYFKTHYPFIGAVGAVDNYVKTHPTRAALIIRDPFEAGFSEYTRMMTTDKHNKLNKITVDDYLAEKEPYVGALEPQKEFDDYITDYFKKWKSFHKYWLRDHKGEVKVFMYKDLVDDIEHYTDLTDFLGHNATLTSDREKRLKCFLENRGKTKVLKRPFSSAIEYSKKTLRNFFYKKETDDAKHYVEKLYFDKFNKTLTIH